MNATFTPTPARPETVNVLSLLKVLVMGGLYPQGLSTDVDAQCVCRFNAD